MLLIDAAFSRYSLYGPPLGVRSKYYFYLCVQRFFTSEDSHVSGLFLESLHSPHRDNVSTPLASFRLVSSLAHFFPIRFSLYGEFGEPLVNLLMADLGTWLQT